MDVKKQLVEPLTARLQLRNNHHLNKLKYGAQTSKKFGINKMLVYDDCMNSISPWGVDQFVSQAKKQLRANSKSKSIIKTNKNDNINKQKQVHLHLQSKPIIIDMKDSKIRQQARRKRSKTEIFKSEVILHQAKLMLNTLQIAQGLQNQQNKNQKYFSQDHKQRKMSMNKIRETLFQTCRSKGLNPSSLNKKMQQRKTFYHIKAVNRDIEQNNPETGNNRIKTAEIQNDNPLIFFFEVKNSKNMMQRQKNIMKIRKLVHGKSKRINTEGLT